MWSTCTPTSRRTPGRSPDSAGSEVSVSLESLECLQGGQGQQPYAVADAALVHVEGSGVEGDPMRGGGIVHAEPGIGTGHLLEVPREGVATHRVLGLAE